jgi:hypothetical protein
LIADTPASAKASESSWSMNKMDASSIIALGSPTNGATLASRVRPACCQLSRLMHAAMRSIVKVIFKARILAGLASCACGLTSCACCHAAMASASPCTRAFQAFD